MLEFQLLITFIAVGSVFLVIDATRRLANGVSASSDNQSMAKKLAIFGWIPLFALLWYWYFGSMDEAQFAHQLKNRVESIQKNRTTKVDDEKFIAQLTSLTKKHQQKVEYWYLLGSEYMAVNDFPAAVENFKKAQVLYPRDATISAQLTEALYLAAGQRLTDEVKSQMNQVLATDPNNLRVLSLLANTAIRAQQYTAAVAFWEKALKALPPYSATAETLRANIAQITAHLTAEGQPDENTQDSPTAIDTEIKVNVSIAKSLISKVMSLPKSAAVYVLAREYSGPPMPIAVQKLAVADLPAKVTLGKNNRMVAGRGLNEVAQIEVVARISASGNPIPNSGDFEGIVSPIQMEREDIDVDVRIDQIIQ